jgi:hypothetical protein
MTKGRLDKKQRQDDQRRKRAQAASVLAQGAKKPVAAVPIASRPQRPPVGRATAAVSEPLPPMSYPIKKAALGKPQTAGGR